MNYCKINKIDTANGEGIRLTLFVSGCSNHCEGCFQPETWDKNYGDPYDKKVEDFIIEELDKEYYDGITILGGDPFEVYNQKDVLNLVKRTKETYPNKNIWIYTGYTFENLNDEKYKNYIENVTKDIFNYIDILVDGRFEKDKKDISLKFKGSSNQRIIDVKETLKNNNIILYNI